MPSSTHHAGHTESQSAYWRAHHAEQSWARDGRSYADDEDAYRTGAEGRPAMGEARLRSNYEARPGAQVLGWDQGASLACRAAWDRADAWERGDLGPHQTER